MYAFIALNIDQNLFILSWRCCSLFLPVWPELAKFRHFGQILKYFDNC